MLFYRKENNENEIYTPTKRMKFYILEVKDGNKEPRITLFKSQTELVTRLFEQEVVEIKNGIVEIKSISVVNGSRTKIAVHL